MVPGLLKQGHGHTLTSPWTTQTSSGGNTASTTEAMNAADAGASSLGFRHTVLPAPTAYTSGTKHKFTGKFHGDTMRATPLGS